MKKALLTLSLVAGIFLGSYALAQAATSVFATFQGGTGTSTPSGILYGDNGGTSHLNTVTIGAGCTFSGGVLSCPGTGTITQINTSFPILGGPITTTGTLTFGGLSTSTPAVVGNLSYFSGVNTFANVATTSVSCSGSVSCTGFTAIGPSPITISASGGATGLATTSPWTVGQLAYVTSNSAVTSVATTSVSQGTGISISGTGTVVGGSGLTITNSSPLSALTTSFPLNLVSTVLSWVGLATTSQPSSSNLLVSNGGAGIYGVATTSVTCSGSTSCSSFSAIGSAPVTISSSGGSAAGSDTQVQFNDGGSSFGGAAGLVWNKSTGFFGVGTTSPYAILSVSTTTQPSGNVFALTGPETVMSQSSTGISTTTYTSNDTFIVPIGATSIDVYMIGGGGGGGGSDGSVQFSGGGGGSSAFGSYIIAGGGGGGGNRSDACSSNAAAGGGGGYAAKTGITIASIGGVGASIPIVVGTHGVFNGVAGVGYFNGGSVTDFTGGGAGGGGATAAGQSRGSAQKTGGAGGSFIGGGGGGVCDTGAGGASGTGAAGGAPSVGGQPGAGGGAASGGGGGGYATSTLSSVTFGYGGGGAAQNAGGAGGAGGGSVKGGDAGASANGGAGSGGGNGGDAGNTGGAGGGFYSATYGKGGTLNSDSATNGVVVVVIHGSPITQTTGFKSIVASLTKLPAVGNGLSTTSTTTLSFGIGTTSPFAMLSLESISGQVSRMVGSMINGIHYVVEEIDQWGHLVTGGKIPTCGTGCASVSGDDRTMEVVTSSSVTSISVNFANTYTKSPVCIPSEENAGVVAIGASTTPTVLTITTASALTTKTIGVVCQISNNFTY